MWCLTGIGVDDTRVDLSQFDEASTAGRSVPPAPHSPSQPDIIVTAGGHEELEQAGSFVEGTESAEVTPAAETTHGWLVSD